MPDNVLVCTAWPYASGPIHLGHLAGHLIPPDIYARFRRMRGDRTVLVSGSDEHGTPITIAAEEAGLTPQELVDKSHAHIVENIERMGIRFDLYSRTSADHHGRTVHKLFLALKEHGHLREHEMDATYCPVCDRFLPDRYVEGVCPVCGHEGARGDQCDNCGTTHDPWDLKAPRCRVCGSAPERRQSNHLFFALDNFEDELRVWIESQEGWRPNVIQSTINWLNMGLRERAVTRDIDWGVPVPLPGFESKRIYVWFEAVMGYFSTTVEWARLQGTPDAWKDFWLDPAATSVYFLGKDNIPYHTIFWPAILLGASEPDARYNLPTNVPANEFLTLSGEQFSKSRRHAIFVHEYLEHFEPAPLRYYLTANMPELKDTDFTIDDFVSRNNDELLGTLGNFINRVLTFTQRNFGSVPPTGELTEVDQAFLGALERARDAVEERLLRLEFKAALREMMELARAGNVYFDRQKPWDLVRTDRDRCGHVLHLCCRVLSGLSVLMAPFLPFKAQELHGLLGAEGSVHERTWAGATDDVPEGREVPRPHPLIRKLDAEEVARRLGLMTKAELEAAAAEEAAAKADECPADALDMVVARVEEVRAHPDADKLYVIETDLGPMGRRTLVAGLKGHYEPDELAGRDIVVVTNLAPATLRGIESRGMLLAAEDEASDTVSLAVPHGDARPGDRLWSPIGPKGKGIVEFKRFQGMDLTVARVSDRPPDLRVDTGTGPRVAHLKEGLEVPDLVVATPEGDGLRLLHTPSAVITIDRPVPPGSPVH